MLVLTSGEDACSAWVLRFLPLISAGGRVLTVVGEGPTFASATARAYAGVDAIHFDGAFARTDIGKKAL